MSGKAGKIRSLWHRMRSFVVIDSASTQDIVLKTGKGELDLTLLLLSRHVGRGLGIVKNT